MSEATRLYGLLLADRNALRAQLAAAQAAREAAERRLARLFCEAHQDADLDAGAAEVLPCAACEAAWGPPQRAAAQAARARLEALLALVVTDVLGEVGSERHDQGCSAVHGAAYRCRCGWPALRDDVLAALGDRAAPAGRGAGA